MTMSFRSVRALALVLVATSPGCREKSPQATADPVAVASTAPPAPKPEPPPPAEAVVTTRRIEVPRTGHDPVVLELPVVKGAKTAAIDDAINALLTPQAILGESLDDVRDEAKAVTSAADLAPGVQGATYEVRYDAHGVLEIEAFTEFMGAYPSTGRFHLLVDVTTGKSIGASAFVRARLPALVKRVDAMLQAEVKSSAAAKDPDFKSLLDGAHFELKDPADFSVSDAGLTFVHDYGFPHVALALQPPGRFFVPWSDLAADIDPKGPLARIHPVP